MSGALENIRVLDLTHVLAGPFCTYQLGLLGAEVIKIENPHDPDCARGRGPDAAGNAAGLGLNYQVQGANKQSLALDLKTPEGRDILRKLVASADALVENYSTGALEGLGLGYDELAAINPALVHCAITGFGDTGPKATDGAYDNTIQATSGIISQCGGVKPGVSFVDYATGYAAAFAVSSALVQAARTGLGTHISVSMLEVAMQMMAPEAAAAQYAKTINRGKEAGITSYDTAEGVLMLGSFRPAQYRRLARCLAALDQPVPALANITDWPDVWAISDATKAELRRIFLTETAAYWVETLQSHDIPAEAVQPLSQAVDSAQLAARQYFQPNPADPDTRLPTAAFHMTTGGPTLRQAPPTLGADSAAVLAGIGLTAAEVAALSDKGVIA